MFHARQHRVGKTGPRINPWNTIAALRAIPYLIVIRLRTQTKRQWPGAVAVEMRDLPVALILTRQNVPTLDRSLYASAEGCGGGLCPSRCIERKPDAILIASGSEVSLVSGGARS